MDKKPEKLVPEVRFKGFTDDWEQRKLGETVFVNSGKDYKGLQKGNIPVYGTGGYMLSVNKYLSNKDAIGIGRKGTINNPYILKAPFWTVDTLFYAIPQNQSDIEFMNAIFQNVNWHKYDESTGVPSLSKSTINQVKVYTTSLREQAAIGSLLHKIEKTISLQQRKLEQLKQLKRAMLQQLFADKNCKQPILRFKSFNDNWEERKLSDIANYRNGKAHEQYIDMNGIYTVVNSKFISTNGKVKKFSNKPIELLKKGEIAFVLSDVPKGKALAKAYLIDSDNKYSLNQRIAGITPSSDINSYFLYVLMNRNRYFLKFDDGVGQTNLSKKDIEEFKENYPLFDEQQKIANLFSQIQTLISLQQNKHTQLIALKKYLLQKLFI